MDAVLQQTVIEKLKEQPGKTAFYYRDLVSGETAAFREGEPFYAASVIKLYIMVEAFARFEEGSLDPDELVAVDPADKVPSCGALTYLHPGAEVTYLDLVTLMIILSDNTATNILIDVLGFEAVNRRIQALGHRQSALQRKMFDAEKSARGIQNIITAAEVGDLLTLIHQRQLISAAACEKMIAILQDQRLNSKLPFFLKPMDPAPKIAHKTGEDTGITHDAGIVYPVEGHPFVLCFLGNETDVCRYERLMADLALEIYQAGEGVTA